MNFMIPHLLYGSDFVSRSGLSQRPRVIPRGMRGYGVRMAGVVSAASMMVALVCVLPLAML